MNTRAHQDCSMLVVCGRLRMIPVVSNSKILHIRTGDPGQLWEELSSIYKHLQAKKRSNLSSTSETYRICYSRCRRRKAERWKGENLEKFMNSTWIHITSERTKIVKSGSLATWVLMLLEYSPHCCSIGEEMAQLGLDFAAWTNTESISNASLFKVLRCIVRWALANVVTRGRVTVSREYQ